MEQLSYAKVKCLNLTDRWNCRFLVTLFFFDILENMDPSELKKLKNKMKKAKKKAEQEKQSQQQAQAR